MSSYHTSRSNNKPLKIEDQYKVVIYRCHQMDIFKVKFYRAVFLDKNWAGLVEYHYKTRGPWAAFFNIAAFLKRGQRTFFFCSVRSFWSRLNWFHVCCIKQNIWMHLMIEESRYIMEKMTMQFCKECRVFFFFFTRLKF